MKQIRITHYSVEQRIRLRELMRITGTRRDEIQELLDLGIIEPASRAPDEPEFGTECIRRVITARRLRRDLGINPPGAALVMDLLDELRELRRRLR